MKKNVLSYPLAFLISTLLFGCGGDDDGGILSIGITDAKPYLPEDVEQVLITFDEVRVHRSGGKWTLLPLPDGHSDYTIDLYQFTGDATTELVPPVELVAGKYTQIRLGITEGWLVTTSEDTYPLEIPSENLKTNRNFYFDVVSGEAVDLMVDFDLSQSIKPKQDGYKLQPVLHLVETQRAAQIRGTIAPSTFVDSEAVVTVTFDGGEYTKLVVTKTDDIEPTEFGIFWLVPNNQYTVEVSGAVVKTEIVMAGDLEPGEVFTLTGSPF